MNDLRMIVAFAIAIALFFPDGSSRGCVALSVTNGETANTELSVTTTGITDEPKYDNPLEKLILCALDIFRSLLSSTEEQFAQYGEQILWIITAIENPFLELSDNAADDTSRARRRRGADHHGSDLPFDLSEVPNLLGNFVTAIPTIIAHPLEFASNVTNIAGEFAANEAGMATNEGFSYLWRFLTTQGLPWLRATLDKLDQSPVIPPNIHQFIKNFDAAYDLAKVLGYIK